MPPKGGAKQSKAADKAKQEKRKQQVEDKTFGLKNKNKSKQVQKYVQNMKQNVAQSGPNKSAGPQLTAAEKRKKKEKEEREQAEFDALFKEVSKKKRAPTEEELRKLKEREEEERRKREEEELNNLPVEEWIEVKRKRLTGPLTPLTLEAFLDWKKRKAAEKAAKEEAAKKDRKKADRLSGRDVFEGAKAEDFKDDDAAQDAYIVNEAEQDAVNAAENGPLTMGSSVAVEEQKGEEELDIDVDDLDEDLLDELDEELTVKASLE
mmetsp:Transcript_13888/g.50580  ORF Transcript_13888/g.50580 Transcript_13888/m.50580 type:complete len:264 (-) Transcript_13888:110-901(-)